MLSKREGIAMSATSYMLVSLPNEQQPTDQVNNRTACVPAFGLKSNAAATPAAAAVAEGK